MRTVVAMSGGVDSSVAALELKEKGREVIGITIKTWPKEECGAEGERMCCSLDAVQNARSVAEDLDIPFYVIDLSKEFAEIVKAYFAGEYAKGRTPNPCIYCNSRIKFGFLLEKARKIGAERIATGHYARIVESGGRHLLAEAKDKGRDQSYFLYDISRDVLPFVDLPLGDCSKEYVRKKASERGLMTAFRKSSQDICFTSSGEGYRGYLEKMGIDAFKPGNILDVNGRVIGKHRGIAAYTIGQRKRLGVYSPEPVYVLGIDPAGNTITVGPRERAYNRRIRVAGFNWLTIERLDSEIELDIRIRHNGAKARATVTPSGPDEAVVTLDEPRFAATPGQAAVFYDGEIVAGGGWIEEVLE